PLVNQHEIRHKLVAPHDGSDVLLYLAASDAGDGAEGDDVLWDQPRIVLPSGDELPLEQVGAVWQQLLARQAAVASCTADYLAAADAYERSADVADPNELAHRRGLDPQLLGAWLDLLGMGTAGDIAADSLL